MSGELLSPDTATLSGVEEVAHKKPLETITEVLQRDMFGAEFLLALFWSAMNSFRHDSILRPFPSMFLERQGVAEGEERTPDREEQKDIEGLVSSA